MRLFIILIFIAIGASYRLLPHAPNFAPIAAMALFSGVYLDRRLALTLPLLAMILSDFFIGFYDPQVMAVVYASFVLTVLIGFYLKKNKKWQNVAACSLGAGVLFYLLTNFSVWIFTPWYSKDIFGLVSCYYLALPFFKNTLLGNLFYSAVFFGGYELAKLSAEKIRLLTKRPASFKNISQ